MSVTLAAALLGQALAITLLRHRLGRRWLRRPVSILILAAVVYQGLSPIFMTVPSIGAWDTYRTGIQQRYIDSATLIMSAGMLAFTVVYLLTCPERIAPQANLDNARVTSRRWTGGG
jgi:hypothetical protein